MQENLDRAIPARSELLSPIAHFQIKNGHQSVAVSFSEDQDYQLRRTEALPVFTCSDERFDHLGSFEIAVELVELR